MHKRMGIYPRAAVERAMKLQEVLLRATAGKIKWWQAAEMMGISERQMRRWKKRWKPVASTGCWIDGAEHRAGGGYRRRWQSRFSACIEISTSI